MKKLVSISLFIFWGVFVAILTTGLVFYQNQNKSNGASPSATSANLPGGNVTLNIKEIAKHNSSGDCWLLISNKVYNVTNYLFAHPGGAGTITPYCGKEATRAFQTKDIGRPHSSSAVSLLNNYYIGDLNQSLGKNQIQKNLNNTNTTPPPSSGEDD